LKGSHVQADLVTSRAFEEWWRATHMGCPFGTTPYKTEKKVTICDMWGLAASGKQWIPESEGSKYRHWEYQDVQSLCLLSHEVTTDVVECLPYVILTEP
jgi:hypothetical protein